jgi:hypothetical protein
MNFMFYTKNTIRTHVLNSIQACNYFNFMAYRIICSQTAVTRLYENITSFFNFYEFIFIEM